MGREASNMAEKHAEQPDDDSDSDYSMERERPPVSYSELVLPWLAVFAPVALTLLLLAWGCGAFGGKEIEQNVFTRFSKSLAEPLRKDLIKPYNGTYAEVYVTDTLSKKDPKPLIAVDGAPKRFFYALFSDSQKIGDCFGAPLLGQWNNGECQYVDMALNVSLFGVIIIPILLLLFVVFFKVVRRMKKISPCLKKCTCNQFGHKEPTMLYPPVWQIFIFVLFFLFCLFIACVSVIGLAAVSHYEWGMTAARDGVQLAESVEATKDGVTLALIEEQTALATATLDRTNKLLDAGVLELRNGVLLDLNRELETFYSLLLGLIDFIEGGDSPACSTPTGQPRPCPDCFACHRALEAVATQLAWLADEDGEYVANLTQHFALDAVRPAIAAALIPIDESAEVLGNHTKLLANISAPLRNSVRDAHTTYTVVSAVFWGISLCASLCALLAAVQGAPFLWRSAFWLGVLALVGAWVLWGVLAVVVVPQGGLCDLLPTQQAGEENELPAGSSSDLFATTRWPAGEDPRFRLLFDACVLNAQANVWTALGIPKADVTNKLIDWDLNRVVPRELRDANLNLINRFVEYEAAKTELLAVRGADVGYNESCAFNPATCPKSAAYAEFLLGFDARRAAIGDASDVLSETIRAASQASNIHRAALSKAAVDVSDTLKATVNAIVDHGSCEPYAELYAGIRDPLCLGANASLGTLWIALFLCCFAWLPLMCLIVHESKHSRQRVRDAKHPALNLAVMFNFKQFKMVKRWRWKEEEAVRKHLGYKEKESATDKHNAISSQGEVAFTDLGQGVDGWGHKANHGEIPEEELEPTLFKRKPLTYSMMDYRMMKGKMEKEGLHQPHRVPRIDRSQLIAPDENRVLVMDKRTGVLRWKDEKGRRRRSSVVKELVPIQRASEILYFHILERINRVEEAVPTEIMKFFKELDTDGSGTIDRAELKAGLEEHGMQPTREEVNLLMGAFDGSNCGLLDINDFRKLILEGKSGHEKVEMLMGIRREDTVKERTRRMSQAMELAQQPAKTVQIEQGPATLISERAAGADENEIARLAKAYNHGEDEVRKNLKKNPNFYSPTPKAAGHLHPATIRVNGHGYLDAIEHLKNPPPPPPPEPRDPHEQFCNDIFDELDTNGDGGLDAEELRLLGAKLGQEWSLTFAEDLVLVLDVNGDEEIDFGEFWGWYKTVIIQREVWDPFKDLDHTQIGNSVMPSYKKLKKYRANLRLQKAAVAMQTLERRASQ